MRTRFSLLLSLGLHGIVASFLFAPFFKLPEKKTFTVEVQWEKSNVREVKAMNHVKPYDNRKSSLRGAIATSQSSKIKTGARRPPLRGARDNGIHLTISVPPLMHTEQTETTTIPPYQPLPKYPWICRKRGQEGSVSLLVHTNAEGRVISVSLHKSSGYDPLDQSALSIVQTWVFPEASGRKILSFTFRLKGREGEVS